MLIHLTGRLNNFPPLIRILVRSIMEGGKASWILNRLDGSGYSRQKNSHKSPKLSFTLKVLPSRNLQSGSGSTTMPKVTVSVDTNKFYKKTAIQEYHLSKKDAGSAFKWCYENCRLLLQVRVHRLTTLAGSALKWTVFQHQTNQQLALSQFHNRWVILNPGGIVFLFV